MNYVFLLLQHFEDENNLSLKCGSYWSNESTCRYLVVSLNERTYWSQCIIIFNVENSKIYLDNFIRFTYFT